MNFLKNMFKQKTLSFDSRSAVFDFLSAKYKKYGCEVIVRDYPKHLEISVLGDRSKMKVRHTFNGCFIGGEYFEMYYYFNGDVV